MVFVNMNTSGPVSVDIHVLFFAKCRELSQTTRSVFTVPSEIRASDLLDKIVIQFGLTTIRHNLIIAHNESFIENLNDSIFLKDGDELAVIPPLSGG
ncbi:molybdopterin synthase sulfur carrier subunit [Drosophila miranda]|uniref:molybdopterin synthase sulfur carrier subunit n=1 Tax=Drosophila miranda TaxID=7229 RepID=UPI0007E72F8B|nr:molybdopterin synthase sulfur carrier subunit [Drosophila miranda]